MAEVKLSQESYDELLADITTLRAQAGVYFEKWQDAKRKAEVFDEIVKVLASISKEIVEYPGDDDKQKEVIYKRWDELFEPMKILEVDHEG
ncbi:hypothetical protein J4Z27_002189 [Staphylococcus epidermidis]|mgnify:FL=1|uniref:hypothetical protein n=1 Tax=Staphylococcus epidermidis TaxID=1282 RepID=UPI001F330D14|nr:hypothetical protein [Staphylococcus epidermidis]UIK39214.1 hypothetical protein J4Z27_002189 [Staphylococcus epidermidis]